MDIKQLLGARIKEIRLKKGITQETLSEQVDINHKYLSSIERGKENPTLNTLIGLAQALDVNLDEFFELVEVEDPDNRKDLIMELLEEANDEQLKLAFKVLSAIIR